MVFQWFHKRVELAVRTEIGESHLIAVTLIGLFTVVFLGIRPCWLGQFRVKLERVSFMHQLYNQVRIFIQRDRETLKRILSVADTFN